MVDPASTEKIAEMRKRIEDARNAEEVMYPPAAEIEHGDGIDSAFIRSCLEANERGDGMLYAAKHKGKFVYVKSRDEKAKAWFHWTGHHWEIDKGDFHHAAVEDVALLYLQEAENTKPELSAARDTAAAANAKHAALTKQLKQLSRDEAPDQELAQTETLLREADQEKTRATIMVKYLVRLQKDYSDRVDRLRSLRGAKNCTEFAHKLGINGLFIYGDEVDDRPMLLPCGNGVIDLKLGTLVAGNPADYLVRAVPVNFTGIDTPCPTWEKFIVEIHRDLALADFVHRFFGYCLTGSDPEQVYAFFIGEGANGKGTMFEILREIFGDLSWSINPEMLLATKTDKSPDGPSPAIMSMQGRRLVMASENEEDSKVSKSKIKRYTGGDTLTGRNLFDKYDTNFTPTHKLVWYANDAPRGLAADFAMMRRLLYISYDLRYVDDPEYHAGLEPLHAHLYRKKDGDLKKKLQAEKEGILAWLVRGCLLWQTSGLKIPDSIRAAVEAVRLKEDYVQQFLDYACTMVEQNSRDQEGVFFKPLYDRFAKWYREDIGGHEKFILSKRKFGEQLRRKGFNMPDPKTSSGKQGVCGITFADANYEELFIWKGLERGSGEL